MEAPQRPEEDAPMLKLYQFPKTTSDRVRWLLDELSIPFEGITVDLMTGENRQPGYLKINPNGLIPTLVDGDATIFESGAILLYLTEKYGSGRLAPPPGTRERAIYYQWIVYTSVSVDPPAFQVLLHSFLLPPEKRSQAVLDDCKARFAAAAQVVEQGLGDRQFLAGDSFTVADLTMAAALYRAMGLGLLAERPKLRKYVEQHTARPAAPFEKSP
jgi:glutathione S-transferase